MKPLATFIMRGPSQAALVAAVTALLSVLVAPLALLSAGAVGLVMLRAGPTHTLSVVGIGTLALGAFSWLALGSPWPALGVLLALWIPVIRLALILRATRSLSLVVQVAGALVILGLLIALLAMGDATATWLQVLEPFRIALVTDGILSEADSQTLFEAVAPWMSGAFAAALLAQLLFGLFIARWWQALLYNPGGFGEEFRTLRLGRVYGVVALLLLVSLPFVGGVGILASLLLVIGVLLFLQGLAVAHQIRLNKQAHSAWLVGLYVLVVLFMPQSILLLGSVGLVDVWVDIRARIAPIRHGGGEPPA